MCVAGFGMSSGGRSVVGHQATVDTQPLSPARSRKSGVLRRLARTRRSRLRQESMRAQEIRSFHKTPPILRTSSNRGARIQHELFGCHTSVTASSTSHIDALTGYRREAGSSHADAAAYRVPATSEADTHVLTIPASVREWNGFVTSSCIHC